MKVKDESITEKLLQCAKAEFLERGFAESSMRTIAERAGVTTGMLYSRFADKGEIFRELVKGPAEELYNFFVGVQEEFAGYRPSISAARCTLTSLERSTAWWISSTTISTPSNL